jgi:FtsZ-binding cell division protein ZapB
MYSHRYLIFTGRESIMTQDNMITELTDTVKHLKRDVDSLKENNKYLYSKLEKAYDDRITLRAENYKLKNPVNTPIMQESEEEECISCSA